MGLKNFENLLLKANNCGVDAMLFIYYFEKNPKYFLWVQKLFNLGESGKIKIITSKITPLEILSSPSLLAQPELVHLYNEYFRHAPYLSVIDIDWDIIERSAKLRRETGLRTPDAIQLATAQLSGAKIFLTNDNHFGQIKLDRIYFLDKLMRI